MAKPKLDLKLNSDAPGQHIAILVLAGVAIFLSVVESIKSPSSPEEVVRAPKGSYAETGETLYTNPQMSWWEKLMCRGYQRSTNCSYRLLHPIIEQRGLDITVPPPKHDNVIKYRGPLPVNRALHRHIAIVPSE